MCMPLISYSKKADLQSPRVSWILGLAAVVFALSCDSPGSRTPAGSTQEPHRIVSLAPSVTETLFALGLEKRLVAVTSYCKYPPQAHSIEHVGGYFDPNLERIVALRPDLVILMYEHEKVRTFLDEHGIRYLHINNATITGICSSFVAIGTICGVPHRADSLVATFHDIATATTASNRSPRVLLCVGRDAAGSGRITTAFAAGPGTFYDEIIQASGGTNAYAANSPRYPELSREGILALAPDIIIDIAPSMSSVACSRLVADWRSLSGLSAVKHDAVHCLDQDFATIPGPRLPLMAKAIVSIIESYRLEHHP